MDVSEKIRESSLGDFVDGVYCQVIHSRTDPEIMEYYYTAADCFIRLIEKDRFRGVPVYRFLTYLSSADGSRRGEIVEWILGSVRVEKPINVFCLLGCCAELLSLGLVVEENDVARLATVALENLENAESNDEQTFLAHVVFELSKINYPGFADAIAERMNGFLEWIGRAKCETVAILGAMLLHVGRQLGQDAEFFRRVIAFFPGDDLGMYGAHFAKNMLVIAESEVMPQIAEDVMLALGRYFAAPPVVRSNMALDDEIVGPMAALFIQLVAINGIEVAQLARLLGATDVINSRLEAVLRSARVEEA
jgi:hypothetical protein